MPAGPTPLPPLSHHTRPTPPREPAFGRAAAGRRCAVERRLAMTAAAPPSLSTTGRIHVLEVIGNAIVGGMETWVERFIERMPRERYRFTALCPFESPYTDRLRALEVEVLIAPM